MISRGEVEALAKLARLDLAGAELEALQKDISGILEYVGQVSAAALDQGQKGAPRLRNVMREDAMRDAGDPLAGKEAALRAAFPRQKDGYGLVRTIIQKDE